MSLDLNKPVTTRDGNPVRILCTDATGDLPVVGLVDGYDHPFVWTKDGKVNLNVPDNAGDLINPPVKKTGWINIYLNRCASVIHDTRDEAIEKSDGSIDTIEITWNE